MANKGVTLSSKNRVIWQTIREEEDIEKALGMVVTATEEAIEESLHDRDCIREEIKKTNKILTGNGDPSHSLIARLEVIEKQLLSVNKISFSVLVLVVGDIVLRVLSLVYK